VRASTLAAISHVEITLQAKVVRGSMLPNLLARAVLGLP
jgi:hypothetical protein